MFTLLYEEKDTWVPECGGQLIRFHIINTFTLLNLQLFVEQQHSASQAGWKHKFFLVISPGFIRRRLFGDVSSGGWCLHYIRRRTLLSK